MTKIFKNCLWITMLLAISCVSLRTVQGFDVGQCKQMCRMGQPEPNGCDKWCIDRIGELEKEVERLKAELQAAEVAKNVDAKKTGPDQKEVESLKAELQEKEVESLKVESLKAESLKAELQATGVAKNVDAKKTGPDLGGQGGGGSKPTAKSTPIAAPTTAATSPATPAAAAAVASASDGVQGGGSPAKSSPATSSGASASDGAQGNSLAPKKKKTLSEVDQLLNDVVDNVVQEGEAALRDANIPKCVSATTGGSAQTRFRQLAGGPPPPPPPPPTLTGAQESQEKKLTSLHLDCKPTVRTKDSVWNCTTSTVDIKEPLGKDALLDKYPDLNPKKKNDTQKKKPKPGSAPVIESDPVMGAFLDIGDVAKNIEIFSHKTHAVTNCETGQLKTVAEFIEEGDTQKEVIFKMLGEIQRLKKETRNVFIKKYKAFQSTCVESEKKKRREVGNGNGGNEETDDELLKKCFQSHKNCKVYFNLYYMHEIAKDDDIRNGLQCFVDLKGGIENEPVVDESQRIIDELKTDGGSLINNFHKQPTTEVAKLLIGVRDQLRKISTKKNCKEPKAIGIELGIELKDLHVLYGSTSSKAYLRQIVENTGLKKSDFENIRNETTKLSPHVEGILLKAAGIDKRQCVEKVEKLGLDIEEDVQQFKANIVEIKRLYKEVMTAFVQMVKRFNVTATEKKEELVAAMKNIPEFLEPIKVLASKVVEMLEKEEAEQEAAAKKDAERKKKDAEKAAKAEETKKSNKNQDGTQLRGGDEEELTLNETVQKTISELHGGGEDLTFEQSLQKAISELNLVKTEKNNGVLKQLGDGLQRQDSHR